MSKPIILISACLEFEQTRYNGQSVPSQIVRDLIPYVDFIKVCPEFSIGLGVPRSPIRIVMQNGEQRLIQHETNRDVTEDMIRFTNKFVAEFGTVDGFIFKSKSPTMGVTNVKVYSGMKGSPAIDRCGGFFASKIIQKYPGYPVEEDDRLRNKKIREHFLTQIYLFADYRESFNNNGIENFHKRNKLLFDFYNEELAKKLEINDNNYFDLIKLIMNHPPTSEKIVQFFTKLIGKDEDILLKYEDNKAGYETLKEVSKILIKDKDILNQTFFQPYPISLLLKAEDDRQKNYWKN
jgi:uncharacterized protein YbbK (DUF523 family)